MARNLLEQHFLKSDVISIDTETNGKDVRDGSGYAYGVSLANEKYALYLPFRHKTDPQQNYDFQEFKEVLQEIIDKKLIIYHNAKFDKVSLHTLGLTTRGRRHICTMVGAQLINENFPAKKSLENCCKYYGLSEGKKLSEEYLEALAYYGYEFMPADLTCEYAATDARITYDLFQAERPFLRQEKLGDVVWPQKMAFTEVLIAMEGRGVKVDLELCEEMADRGYHEMARLKKELGGRNPSSRNDLEEMLINELHLPIVKLTPAGKPSFDKYAMEDYELILHRTNSPIAKNILAYRGWQKSVSSNYEPYLAKVSHVDWRLRPNYNQHRVKTGRLSCESPNLQQIPKSGDKPWNGRMKSCFVPEEGFELWEADYSQLEMRMQASFAKEQVLLDCFDDPNRDMFDEMSLLVGMSRFDTKTLNYSISYGAGIRRIQSAFGVSKEKAIEYRNNYYKAYPNIRKASTFASQYVLAHKKIKLWTGRYRHFLYPKEESHKAFNSFVQGGAADIVERAMLRLNSEGFNTDDCRMLLQVHDSVVFEIRKEKVSEYLPGIKECMERVDGPFGNVKFRVDIKRWGMAA